MFVVLQSGLVAAHRASDGGELWHVDLRSDHGVVIEGSRVFVGAAGGIHALDVETGAEAWHSPSAALTAPLLVRNGWIVAATAAGLSAFRSADGTEVWSRETGAQHVRATIEGDNLYVPLDDGRLLALDLRTGADRWKRHFAGPLSEVLALPDRVFAGSADKYFYALNAETGADAWRSRLGVSLQGAPIADATRVFAAGMDNVIRAYDRGSGALRWHTSVPFRPTGVVLVGSSILVPGMSAELHAFGASSGKAEGKITLDQKLVAAPGLGTLETVVVMAAVTGSLTGDWKLIFAMEPPKPPPSIDLVPLIVMPGTTVPVATPGPPG